MCWVSNKAIKKIAERDFYVYKIGKVVWNTIFVSDIRGHNYVPKCPNRTISLLPLYLLDYINIIQEGYHSYKWVAIDNSNPRERYLYLGNYDNALKENLSLYEHCCIATFIVPKGSEYYENPNGEIVSSNIIYTGKYIKL